MIRDYEPRDCEDVVRVWAAASAIAHPFLSEEFLARERTEIRNVYLPNTETWVWEHEGKVVGFLSLLGHEVGAIFVHPDSQRSGIGRSLLDHARTQRGELGVEVFVDNAIGRAFYAKIGFEPMLERLHEESGFRVMRLRLAEEAKSDPQGEP